MNPALAEFTPEGLDKLFPTMPKDWMEAVFGNAFNPDGLDAKTRLLVTLGGLVATGRDGAAADRADRAPLRASRAPRKRRSPR